jgi:hypothetical protein
VEKLADYSRGVVDWVDGNMKSTSSAFLLAGAAVFAVIVE